MTEQASAETKRGRVRRLVIDPVESWGMSRRPARPKGETRAEADARADKAHKAFIDRVCDELGHMSEDQLSQMRRWCEVSGEGDKRNYWPDFVTIAGAAHSFCPRPVEDLPELASWFGSRKGLELSSSSALLVAHLRFITKFRHPPVKPADLAKVGKKADEMMTEWLRAVELRDRGRPFEERFLAEYERDLARAQRLVDAGVHRRSNASEHVT